MAISKDVLSASVDGKPIKVVGTTAAAATTIHTAAATGKDSVTIYAHNNHTSAVELVLLWGDATTDTEIKKTIGLRDGEYLVIDSRLIKNSLPIKAYCATANVLFIGGFYTRET